MNALNKVVAYRRQAEERRVNGHTAGAGQTALATATAGERRLRTQ
jgi:hypothetical protein